MTGTTISTSLTSSLTLSNAAQGPVEITSAGAIVAGGGIAIYGSSGTAWSISNAGTLAGSSAIRLLGGGVLDNGATGLITGSGAAGAVQIAGAGTVANLGDIVATYAGSRVPGAAGVSLGGGYLSNGAAGSVAATISGYFGVLFGGAGSVANHGTLLGINTPFYAHSAGAWLEAGGSVINGDPAGSGGYISGEYGVHIAGAAGTVTNFGTIGGVNAVVLVAGGTVTNGAAAGTAALITASTGDAISAFGTDTTIVNFGTVTSASAVGVSLARGILVNGSAADTSARIAGNVGVYASTGIATINNYGTIIGATIGVDTHRGDLIANRGSIGGGAIGIELHGTQVVANYGTISGLNQGINGLGAGTVSNAAGAMISGDFGVYMTAPGRVENSGTIVGAYYGVYLARGGTVVNAGSIGGSLDAVVFGGGASTHNRLILSPGATFGSAVLGAAAANNVVELAAGTRAGTLGGFGVTMTGFSGIVVDTAAKWSLAGTSDLADSHVQNAGTLTVTGSAVATQSFALTGPGALTVAAAATLQAGGTIASALHDLGTLVAAGTLSLRGFAVGSGTIAITAGADLSVNGVCGVRHLEFLPGAGATLAVSQSQHFTSIIGGFAAGDTIDLVHVAATSASFGGTTLTLTGLSGAVASLHFAAGYPANAFTATSDGHGGTNIHLA